MGNSSSYQTPTPAAEDDEWNYHNCPYCNRRVPINENLSTVICRDCDYRFVEFGAAVSESDQEEDDNISYYYGTVPLSLDPQSADDLIGSELNRSDNDEENDEEEIGGENNEGANSSDFVSRILPVILALRQLLPNPNPQSADDLIGTESNRSDDDEEIGGENNQGANSSDIMSMILRLILALNGLFSNLGTDYDQILNRLAETGIGSKGAPPAAKSVVSGLPTVEILTEADAADCTICQDVVGVGELMKKLPCGHGYHGDCIVTWLEARNSCPVCRFELPTDDVEYEEMRKSGRKGGRTGEIGF